MEENDLHYLGGLIDADGSIYVQVRKTDRAKFGFYISPVIHVVGVDKEEYNERHHLLRGLANEIGADFGMEMHPNDGTKKTVIQGSTAVKTLEALAPYLREKKPQAERILKEDWDGNQTGQVGRSKESYRSLVECREDIHKYMSVGSRRKYDREHLLAELG